jgi:hypothetical protein
MNLKPLPDRNQVVCQCGMTLDPKMIHTDRRGWEFISCPRCWKRWCAVCLQHPNDCAHWSFVAAAPTPTTRRNAND